jgi:hypothetical protein
VSVARGLHAALLLCLLLSACAHTFDARGLGVPVTMATPATQPPQGDRFSVTSHAVFGLWGVISIKEPSLRKALAAQLAGGSGVADLRIKVKSGFLDVILTGITLGLIVPRSVTFEGVVTR